MNPRTVDDAFPSNVIDPLRVAVVVDIGEAAEVESVGTLRTARVLNV